jgi:murein L,D-transpeptidase YafK
MSHLCAGIAAICALSIVSQGDPVEAKTRTRQTPDYLVGSKVRHAVKNKEAVVRAMVKSSGLPYPPRRIFLRAFKRDMELEVWAQGKKGAAYTLLKTYDICAAAGALGPKRRAGDHQVPEGFYRISAINRYTRYHLGLTVSYPNASDKILGRKGALGSEIMVHGDCASIGCLAMTNPGIEEIYLLAARTYQGGGRHIPLHIFPTRLDLEGYAWLISAHPDRPALHRFWRGLQPGFLFFERHRKLPRIRVDKKGRYLLRR